MKLTLEDILLRMVRLWTWLSEHPEAEKGDWPYWPGEPVLPASCCWACEYAIQQQAILGSNRGCDLCPLKELWPNGCETEEKDNTVYEQWKYGNREQRALAARAIVAFCNCKLEVLRNKR